LGAVALLAVPAGALAGVAAGGSQPQSTAGQTVFTVPGETSWTVQTGVTAVTVSAVGGQGWRDRG
jgi:hypothetical protein